MLIDTHAHINMLSNPEQGIIEAREAGVKEIIIPSASSDDFENILEICHKFDDVYATLGVHPEDCEKFSDNTAKKIMNLAQHKKVVGIGEIGLDYHYTKENKDIQKRVFKTQLEIAKILNLPVVIHDREAHEDTFEIIQEFNLKDVVFHCFSGNSEFAQKCIDKGYYIAIGGVVTFKNAKDLKEVAKIVPLEKLLLETDAPYLAPVPYRGKLNTPAYLKYIAQEIANIKEIDVKLVKEQTTQNAKRIFGI